MADGFTIRKPGPQTKAFVNWLGNVLVGLALAFLIDRFALGGKVADILPEGISAFLGFAIFAGAVIYGYGQAKKLN